MRVVVNLPWSIIGLMLALTCRPKKFRFVLGVLAIETKRIWFLKNHYIAQCWHRVVIYKTGAEYVLPHELIHTQQYERCWGLFPLLYLIEATRRGYHNNRFEKEARERSGV